MAAARTNDSQGESPRKQPTDRALQSPANPGFDFTHHVRTVCEDMVTRRPELGHIDMRRVAISYCQARKAVGHGLQASLTPLRFEGGALTTERDGRQWKSQRLFAADGTEYLYLLSFYLPRFLNAPLREKLVTIAHELWHISQAFDGDLRRHPGRCYVHSASEREYDARMEKLVDAWLAERPPEAIYRFLKSNFRQLCRKYGNVYGVRIPAPKLLPVR